MSLHEVVPGVHAWVQPDGTWWLNNAGAVADGGQVLLVDTCATETRTRRFLAAVERATGGGTVRLAVNTHQHGDHSYGNSLLPAATVIVGHEHMREGLRVDPVIDGCPPLWQPVPDWGAITRRLPDVTVRDRLTIHVGQRRVDVVHPGGPAHTTGDLVAWLPQERVLFAGDLVFNGLTPLVFMGSVAGAAGPLDGLAPLDPPPHVPAPAPPQHPAEITPVFDGIRRYLRLVQDTAAAGMRAGLTPLEAARACDLGEFAGWADAERIVPNLHRAYADALGTDVDVVAALTDAVTWRGAPMATKV